MDMPEAMTGNTSVWVGRQAMRWEADGDWERDSGSWLYWAGARREKVLTPWEMVLEQGTEKDNFFEAGCNAWPGM